MPPRPALPPNAIAIAAMLAVDPAGLGGVVLRAAAGPLRDAWLQELAQRLPAHTPQRRVPLHVADERLLGGLDLPATLKAGRPVAQRGLLAETDGGVLILAMAERVPAATAAHIAAVLDTHELRVQRDGVALHLPVRLGVVALDEGLDDDEQAPARLADRLAFHVRLDGRPPTAAAPPPADWSADAVSRARALLEQVAIGDDAVTALCATAHTLGVASLRAAQLAVRAARVAAALAGRLQVEEPDAALAARCVLAHRATRLPGSAPDHPDEAPAEPPPADDATQDLAQAATDDAAEGTAAPPQDAAPRTGQDVAAAEQASAEQAPIDDVLLAVAVAALPPDLLARLKLQASGAAAATPAGRSGALQASRLRGRPQGVRRGLPRGGARLHLVDTLRAAAPWQTLRRQQSQAAAPAARAQPPRIQVRHDDLRVTRLRQHSPTTTVFVVDASGSAALHRLAEAKGAVELLLADCYVRRDSVAVIAFRRRGAELLLPPTRSLLRAKRALAGLPGGGGTPLAAGIDAAAGLADAVQRRGGTPVLVLLTDGHANIARDGSPGRALAGAEALAAARQVRLAGVAALLLDTSPQPQATARQLAQALGAAYLPLPQAGARALSLAARSASEAAARQSATLPHRGGA